MSADLALENVLPLLSFVSCQLHGHPVNMQLVDE